MHSVVHYLQKYQSKDEEAFVKHGEQDHVADYSWWGRNEGKMVAQTQETKQEKIPFEDNSSCESVANSEMHDVLRRSASEEALMSKIEYDVPNDSGIVPHNWPPAPKVKK